MGGATIRGRGLPILLFLSVGGEPLFFFFFYKVGMREESRILIVTFQDRLPPRASMNANRQGVARPNILDRQDLEIQL